MVVFGVIKLVFVRGRRHTINCRSYLGSNELPTSPTLLIPASVPAVTWSCFSLPPRITHKSLDTSPVSPPRREGESFLNRFQIVSLSAPASLLSRRHLSSEPRLLVCCTLWGFDEEGGGGAGGPLEMCNGFFVPPF